MYTLFVISVTLALATCTFAGIYGKEETISLESYGGGGDIGGGGGGGGGYGGLGDHIGISLGGGGGGGGGLYSGPSSYETSGDQSGGGGGGGGGGSEHGDYHHGVSIIGGGGDDKGASFDLTNHGWSGHSGPFGGSFVASAKYEGHSGVAHKVADGDAHGAAGLITFGSPHYTDVLSAGDDGGSIGGGGGGGGGGSYKWGFVEAGDH